MTTYVLVHGAWHGGWCWRKVTPLLRAAGHVVYTPTLTGLGERVHLATPEVNLSTHITDVVNTLFYEDLHDVVLVGHSYGGQVISGVAQKAADRIEDLVYLDSMVPNDGESVMDIIRRGGSRGPMLNDDWRFMTEWNFGITDPEDIAWARRHLVPYLRATMLEPLPLPNPIDDGAYGRMFILASNPGAGSPSLFEPLSRHLRDDPKWQFREVPTGHDVMVTMPNELAQILLELAQEAAMTTFVLVHGAWGGSFGWHKVAPLLRAAGHDVYTPALTGLGERSHLATPETGLNTHVTDVANVFEFEELSDVVLVGHSYGGMVVTGAVDKIGDRVSHLVYLDAFVPGDGQAISQVGGAIPPGEDWLIPSIPRPLPDKEEEAWLAARRHPQPRLCFTEPVSLSKPLEQHPFSLTYIKATADARENASERRSGFWQVADHVRNDPRWSYREIATSHMVQNEKPEELVSLLLEVLK